MLDRQMQIIHLFIKNSMKTLSSDEISEFINVSNRTVRNDIHVINSNFMDNIIISVKSKGYLLNTTHYTLDAINERYNHIQSYKEKLCCLWRINYLCTIEHIRYSNLNKTTFCLKLYLMTIS